MIEGTLLTSALIRLSTCIILIFGSAMRSS
jgi:hypothetical protein